MDLNKVQKSPASENLNDFELKVKNGLEKCGIYSETLSEHGKCIGAGVSGGADSISLLVSLCKILKNTGVPIFAVTVNHYIRSDEETCGDVEYVKQVCKNLKEQGFFVECIVYELEKGKIQEYCQENKTSIEETARKFRYEAFENAIQKYNLSFFCLAHNQNDQLETALMRFLQGNSSETLSAIPRIRGKYVRPLLEIPRAEIEKYLNEKNISWRTDATNFDTLYLRNRIRQKLVPFLNEQFEGWQKSVLTGVEKAEEDKNFMEALVDDFPMEITENQVIFNKMAFISEKKALQQRILLKACNVLGFSQRISYSFLKDALDSINNVTDSSQKIYKTFGDIEIICEKDRVLVKKKQNLNTDLWFFVIIDKEGIYDFPFGKLEVFSAADKAEAVRLLVNQKPVNKDFDLPFIVRNAQPDDEILAANGKYKKISKIYKDWQLSEEIKEKIPVIQKLSSEQEILCILGKTLGAEDWIIK